ncbi:condensation domain-containing protein [Anaerococcus rubeinfantis]|uniref:condensation domain-containing protein n=1 Tax=Anaerococcus rubeinfantis TaxID=1720199 RepID=UPI00073E83D3|nr:condensation domain-containing protein [Anaerococcus rubeinfantis]
MEKIKKPNDLQVFNYLKNLKEKGLYLYMEDKNLKYKIKKSVISHDVLNEIRNHKEQISNFLLYIKDNYVDLSSMQLAYMAGQSKNQILNKVNAHYYIEFSKENIDVVKLENAVNVLIQQNDALRMIILSTGQGIILNKMPKYKVQTYNLAREEDKLNARENLSRKIYGYDYWPMFTIIVGKSNDSDDILHFSFDCSILDAWCAGKLINNLFSIYSGQKLEKAKYDYKDYIHDLESYMIKNQKILQKAEKYWENRILDISDGPKLAYKKNFQDLDSTTFVRQEYTFGKDIVTALERYSRLHKVTLTSAVMTVYMKVLSDMSRQKELSINITIFGKLPLNNNIDDVLGEFTNIGLIEYKDKQDNFIEAVQNTQNQIFKILEFRAYDGVNILNKARKTGLGKERFFPIVMTCMIGENYTSILNGFKEEYSLSQTPQVVLDHHVRMIDNEMKISFDYIKELFDYSYINKIIENYKQIIFQVCGGDF